MRQILKYSLPGPDLKHFVEMSRDANILCVHEQDNHVVVWADVITDATVAKVTRRFQLVPTGGMVPDGKYLGTVFIRLEREVIHVYEVQ